MNKFCEYCGNGFYTKPSEFARRRFCSIDCKFNGADLGRPKGTYVNTVDSILNKLVWDGDCLVLQNRTVKRYLLICIEGKREALHRLVFKTICGPVPKGKELHHTCSNKSCANLAHIEVVTRKEHIYRDRFIIIAQTKVTHCPYGHPYNEENTYYKKWDGRISRQCRMCNKIRCAAYSKNRQITSNS